MYFIKTKQTLTSSAEKIKTSRVSEQIKTGLSYTIQPNKAQL